MPVNPQTLANDARCYGKCIPPGDWLPALIVLAGELAGGVTGTFRITEPGATRVTQAGETRIVE